MKFHFYLLAALINVQAFGLDGALKKTCDKFPSPVPGGYCIWATEGSQSPDVLYHFHGATLSEEVWGDKDFYPEMVRERWASKGVNAPTVVSISFGPLWLLVEKNSEPNSGLLELFLQRIIPYLDKKLGGVKGKRLVIGESMGGFNAAVIALKGGSQFDRVAILCPGMVNLSPSASEAEIEAYVKRTGANRKKVEGLRTLVSAFIPNEEAWRKSSPLELAPAYLGASTPKMYVSCGTSDSYGFFEGTELFVKIAKAKRARFEWHPVWHGDHCAVDVNSLADFLVN